MCLWMALARSLFADALTLTLAALSADSPARCFTRHGGLRLPRWPGLRMGVGSRLLARMGSCSVTNSCPAPCDLMDCSLPGSSVFYSLAEFAPIHVC